MSTAWNGLRHDLRGRGEVTRAVRLCQKPVYIKLSPNVTDIAAIAKAARTPELTG